MIGQLLALLLLLTVTAPPDRPLADRALEARAVRLGEELRCLVCENESLNASPAPLAGDLRTLIRERIAAGDTDRQIRDLMAARYGEFVLFRPRLNWRNLLLWLGPFALLGAASAVLVVRARAMRAPSGGPES
ncbi:MAG: cytochrome c-type biogenesis protein [Alphaproteobacteria bacterium]